MPLYDRTYSEEADEIIGTMPSWIVRWGITLIFVLLALLFLGCYFIRYPQTVTGTITLTTVPPPVDVTAPHTGIAEAVATEGQTVAKGDVLVLYATRDEYREVQHLEKSLWLPTDETLPDDLRFSYAAYRANGSEATLQQPHVGDRSVEGAARRRGSGRRACDTAQQRSVPTSDDSRRVAGEHPARGRDGGRRPASSAGRVTRGCGAGAEGQREGSTAFPTWSSASCAVSCGRFPPFRTARRAISSPSPFPTRCARRTRRSLPLIHGMDGTAEIITKEMRLIEHFIQPVRALYDKNAE